ncbi:MAG: FAD-dependent oxidoreductase, partial [Bacteroidaceae bacterium]|nr:FAD-dependent oxidoreductase [Bacteroidaceae bacterium]
DAREVGTCFMTGEAAGTAAAQAVSLRRGCRDIDVRRLQETLRMNKVKLEW